jgi:hypothetical protein
MHGPHWLRLIRTTRNTGIDVNSLSHLPENQGRTMGKVGLEPALLIHGVEIGMGSRDCKRHR